MDKDFYQLYIFSLYWVLMKLVWSGPANLDSVVYHTTQQVDSQACFGSIFVRVSRINFETFSPFPPFIESGVVQSTLPPKQPSLDLIICRGHYFTVLEYVLYSTRKGWTRNVFQFRALLHYVTRPPDITRQFLVMCKQHSRQNQDGIVGVLYVDIVILCMILHTQLSQLNSLSGSLAEHNLWQRLGKYSYGLSLKLNLIIWDFAATTFTLKSTKNVSEQAYLTYTTIKITRTLLRPRCSCCGLKHKYLYL